jgi:hypothetical protein
VTYINGVNLLPGTGEFTYDTVAHLGQRATGEPAAVPVNFYASGETSASYSGEDTDLPRAIDNLQAEFPACTTVSVVVSWFFDSLAAGSCRVYPSTTYIGGSFSKWNGSAFIADTWKVSSLTQASAGLIPITSSGSKFSYGGTPSDPSIVNAITELKSRGLRVVFYPFLLGDPADKTFPWRGRITHSPDKTTAAETAVAAFLGSAVSGNFTRDATNKTVSYSGSSTDWTYRRMILHYANLCVIAGGVDLFIVGSELRGLETIRGTGWTKAGSGSPVTWDYPFVAALKDIADDVRGIFDAASLTKNLTTKKNLISYASDWSSWMGWQHPGEDGQWPHLDQLWAHTNIDRVCVDNYLPLSDWTTGDGGLDVLNWSEPKFSGTWPPTETQMNGLGLSGSPTIHSKAYLKANIEGGEKCNWYYAGSDANLGRGLDPKGSGAQVSRPQGNRLSQTRSRFYTGQEILAPKQFRWWWKHQHKAVYDTGSGWVQQGGVTGWTFSMKPIAFSEYGFPSCDRATNQPNVFFDPKSTESGSPFWSQWRSAFGGTFLPREDKILAPLALQAIHEYWFVDGNNETSGGGVDMLDQAFCSVWAWDARPFPTFPRRADVWGDAPNWPAGNWVQGKGSFSAPASADSSPGPGTYPAFPDLPGLGWSMKFTPVFRTEAAHHVSGRESRAARRDHGLLEIELTYNFLRQSGFQGGTIAEYEALRGFFEGRKGAASPFTIAVPAALGFGTSITARFADDQLDFAEFMARLHQGESVKIMQVRGE